MLFFLSGVSLSLRAEAGQPCPDAPDTPPAACYTGTLTRAIDAGDSVRVRVNGSAGLEASGSAVAVLPPVVVAPAGGTVILVPCAGRAPCEPASPGGRPLTQVGVDILPDSGHRRIEVQLRVAPTAGGPACEVDGGVLSWDPASPPPEISVPIQRIRCVGADNRVVAFERIEIELVAIAYDANYAAYRDFIRGRSAAHVHELSFGLVGAAGVVGSWAMGTARIRVEAS